MDLSNSIAIWRNVLTKPSEATFEVEKERPTANLTTALIWVVAASLINFIAQAITFLIFDPVQQFIDLYTQLLVNSGTSQTMIDDMLAQMTDDSFKNTMMLALFLGVILFPLIFLLGSGILWGVARVFGGNGDYSKQTYLISTYYAPLTIINILASFIPFVGFVVALGVMVYQVVLTYFAMRVAHQLTPGKAMGAIVTPFVGLFAVSCCCSFVLVGSLASLQ